MARVLVVGTASGVGAAAAIGLAEDGHLVAAGSPGGDRPEGATSDLPIEPVRLDLTEPATFEPALDQIRRGFGGLDWVVITGVAGPLVPLELIDPELLADLVEVNLVGPLRLLQIVLGELRRSPDGRIVVVSSLAGVTGLPASGACSAARAGLEAALEALHLEVAADAINVSVIQPALGEPDHGDAPGAVDGSEYDQLVQRATELRHDARRWCSDRLVVDQLRHVLAHDAPAFHYPMGAYAATLAELQIPDARLHDFVADLYHLDHPHPPGAAPGGGSGSGGSTGVVSTLVATEPTSR